MSYSTTYSTTFTVTHAKYLASKVATDLKRIQRSYNDHLSDLEIENYEKELTTLLKDGYLKKVSYGFIRNGKFIEPTIIYTANDLSNGLSDDDPGRIMPNMDIEDAIFGSFLTYSEKWGILSTQEREKIEKELPIKRTTGNEPSIDGYLVEDKTYSSGGRSISRSSVKKY